MHIVTLLAVSSEELHTDVEYLDLCYMEYSSLKYFVCESQLDVLLRKWADILWHENRQYQLQESTNSEHL